MQLKLSALVANIKHLISFQSRLRLTLHAQQVVLLPQGLQLLTNNRKALLQIHHL